MCAHVKSCHLLCPAMGWNVMSLKLHYSLGNSSVLQSTTPEYKGLLQYNPVLQSTTPVLLCTRKYDSSTTPVLLQYYSVLQRTSPVLLCTTKYYSSTTPILLCTTKPYSSTTKYYSSTTPILLCTTVLQSTTKCYSVLQSPTPALQSSTKCYSSTTKYYSTTPELQSTTLYYKVLLRYYFETSFTLRTATGIALTPHQILPLPRKMNVMIVPAHI